MEQLVKRDFKVKYKRSFLGILWSVLSPLFTMAIMNFVFKHLFGRNVDHYTLYLFAGWILFVFFKESTSSAMNSITANFKLINKVKIPKFLLPISKIIFSSINLGIMFLVFIIFSLIEKVYPTWLYLWILYLLPCFMMFILGMSLFLAATSVFFRDIKHLYSVLLTAWMYATPIMYPMSMLPVSVQAVLRLNPMYQFIEFFREITIYQTVPSIYQFGACFACGVLMLLFGGFVFYKTQKNFIYYA